MVQNKYPGKFIVLDGLDGSGMSTQANKIVDFLNEKKQKIRFGYTGVYLTKEPTSSLIGGIIKSQLTHDWKSSNECLQLLFSADRAYHLDKEIIPMLERGIAVVCDRYFFSTVAFGALKTKDFNWLLSLQKNFLVPDLIFILKVSPKICIERIKKERFEATLFEKEETLKEVWENFQKLARKFKNKTFVINGERPVDKITKDIIKIVTDKLRK
jgi:dTMP kinase